MFKVLPLALIATAGLIAVRPESRQRRPREGQGEFNTHEENGYEQSHRDLEGGSPFGTAKVKGTILRPKTHLVVKAKGGSFVYDDTGVLAGGKVNGTWKVSKGKGKYKGIKGGGKFTQPTGKVGDNPTTFALTGKVTY